MKGFLKLLLVCIYCVYDPITSKEYILILMFVHRLLIIIKFFF